MTGLKKIIGIFLAAMILAVTFACANDSGGNTDNTGAANTAADNAENNDNNNAAEDGGANTEKKADKWAREPHNLPEMDFGGREFKVVTVEVTEAIRFYEHFASEEQTGEPINDALYTRKLNVEDQYNITMKTNPVADPSGTARKSILAGDNEVDLIVHTLFGIRDLASKYMLADLYTTPYISDNLDEQWWDQSLKRDLSINGKLFFQAGDIVLKDKLRLAVMYFNKDMFKTIGVDYPYQDVYDGKWTIDRVVELTKNVNKDLNGDGVMDQYDQWGLMSQYENGLHMFLASGERTISLNKDGVPEITMNTPRAIEVIQKVLNVSTDGVTMYHADGIKGSSNVWYTASEYFQENRFLMRTSLLEPVVRDLRAMPTDFGILPYVKYDENQEEYYTYVAGDGLFVAIPNTADLEFAGFITEALAYKSGTTLMPAFYDLCLTSKVLRDDESEGMLDIIFNAKIYDIGCTFGIGTTHTMLSDLVKGNKTDFISQFEKSQGAIEKALEKFISTYGEE